jgi:hypothetical protein
MVKKLLCVVAEKPYINCKPIFAKGKEKEIKKEKNS